MFTFFIKYKSLQTFPTWYIWSLCFSISCSMTHLIWRCVLTLNTSNKLSLIITGLWLLYDLNNHSSYFKTQNLLEKMSCARVYGSNKLSLILRLWGYGTLCNLEIIHSFLDVELIEKFYILDLARIAFTYSTIFKLEIIILWNLGCFSMSAFWKLIQVLNCQQIFVFLT